MGNIVTGRQLRAARILAALTQRQLAKAVGVHERCVRYWEGKEEQLPTCVADSLIRIEEALLNSGVIVFAEPTPGARVARERNHDCR